MTIQLSPGQDLVMEVLAARHRLGESWWPFSNKLGQQLRKLEAHGLIRTMHGTVERTTRARLTDEGIAMYCDMGYVPPVFEKYKLKKKYR